MSFLYICEKWWLGGRTTISFVIFFIVVVVSQIIQMWILSISIRRVPSPVSTCLSYGDTTGEEMLHVTLKLKIIFI